ncbi:MAG: hypothetical protein BA863_08140 [Desulfovibrio sp. S3730MH75]|nr:MAG: hypothetical protein BA863_08140 [Desulfovibrio sp. S3730MH75]
MGKSISNALDRSLFLVTLCSPRAVASKYVAQEIYRFKQTGKGNRIIAAILDGEPGDPAKECFSPPLRHPVGKDGNLNKSVTEEPIAADFRIKEGHEAKPGFTSAEAYRLKLSAQGNLTKREIKKRAEAYDSQLQLMKLKIIAGILGVPLEKLRDRDKAYQLQLEQKKSHRFRIIAGVMAVLFIAALFAARVAYQNQRQAEQQLAQSLLAPLGHVGLSPEVGFVPLGDHELAAIENLAATKSTNVRLDFFRNALSTPMKTKQFLNRSSILTNTAVALDSKFRKRLLRDIIIPACENPSLPEQARLAAAAVGIDLAYYEDDEFSYNAARSLIKALTRSSSPPETRKLVDYATRIGPHLSSKSALLLTDDLLIAYEQAPDFHALEGLVSSYHIFRPMLPLHIRENIDIKSFNVLVDTVPEVRQLSLLGSPIFRALMSSVKVMEPGTRTIVSALMAVCDFYPKAGFNLVANGGKLTPISSVLNEKLDKKDAPAVVRHAMTMINNGRKDPDYNSRMSNWIWVQELPGILVGTYAKLRGDEALTAAKTYSAMLFPFADSDGGAYIDIVLTLINNLSESERKNLAVHVHSLILGATNFQADLHGLKFQTKVLSALLPLMKNKESSKLVELILLQVLPLSGEILDSTNYWTGPWFGDQTISVKSLSRWATPKFAYTMARALVLYENYRRNEDLVGMAEHFLSRISDSQLAEFSAFVESIERIPRKKWKNAPPHSMRGFLAILAMAPFADKINEDTKQKLIGLALTQLKANESTGIDLKYLVRMHNFLPEDDLQILLAKHGSNLNEVPTLPKDDARFASPFYFNYWNNTSYGEIDLKQFQKLAKHLNDEELTRLGIDLILSWEFTSSHINDDAYTVFKERINVLVERTTPDLVIALSQALIQRATKSNTKISTYCISLFSELYKSIPQEFTKLLDNVILSYIEREDFASSTSISEITAIAKLLKNLHRDIKQTTYARLLTIVTDQKEYLTRSPAGEAFRIISPELNKTMVYSLLDRIKPPLAKGEFSSVVAVKVISALALTAESEWYEEQVALTIKKLEAELQNEHPGRLYQAFANLAPYLVDFTKKQLGGKLVHLALLTDYYKERDFEFLADAEVVKFLGEDEVVDLAQECLVSNFRDSTTQVTKDGDMRGYSSSVEVTVQKPKYARIYASLIRGLSESALLELIQAPTCVGQFRQITLRELQKEDNVQFRKSWIQSAVKRIEK